MSIALNGGMNYILLKYSESLMVVLFSPKMCPPFCDPMDCSMQASISSTISQCLLKIISIESVMLSDHLILSTISYSPFSFCLQFFPASVSFPISQLFASGGLSIGALAPSNEY